MLGMYEYHCYSFTQRLEVARTERESLEWEIGSSAQPMHFHDGMKASDSAQLIKC